MWVRGDVSIRPADDEDVRRYIEDRTDRHRFLDHLARQRGILLFAFGADELLGHVFLRRAAAEEAELRAGLPGVPLLQHLWVIEKHRRCGVGTRLVREAETRLHALGHRRVALGVHPGNSGAISFYEALSFTVWREDTLTTFREHVQDDGSTVREEEPCLVFVKRIEPPPSRGRR
jgi:GNAT superfamily N-acetyltransferase